MLYFAYGSNMDVPRMEKRKTGFEFRCWAKLVDYELTFDKVAVASCTTNSYTPSIYVVGGTLNHAEGPALKGLTKPIQKRVEFMEKSKGYANVQPKPGSVVEGALYVVPPSGIQELDGHEGCPTHYTREVYTVELANGVKVDACIYIANPAMVADALLPEKSYLDYLLGGKDILSTEYHAKLAAQETIKEKTYGNSTWRQGTRWDSRTQSYVPMDGNDNDYWHQSY